MSEGNGTGSPPADESKKFLVAGIGATAGGIGALREFFSHVRANSSVAYVVIMHLSPEHASNLSSVLQNQTTVPVTEVTATIRIEPNRIYVIPPNKYLMVEDGVIELTEPERRRGSHTSIDLCFRTLAEAHGKDAVAIVLSGTGADGTLGLSRIKEKGGFVIVQDPDEAEYADMPRSAISTGLTDIILPVQEIPAKLLTLRDGAQRLSTIIDRIEEPAPDELDEDEALRGILSLVRLRTSNEFQQYKRPTLLRRVVRRMQVHEQSTLKAYLKFLRDHPEEVALLLSDLLISVTSFFRDHESFEFLEKEIIPQLFAGKGPHDEVRVWSAGCATGEEAYSLAMLLVEYCSKLDDPPKIQVFATDIDEHAIAKARDCRYPNTISLDVAPERLEQFFLKEGDYYRLKKELRDHVLFALHNILRDPPFSKVDLIVCRNLLIYLTRTAQERVLETFHFALRADGFLFLGASESAEMEPRLFAPLDMKRRIYRRRAATGLIGAKLNPSRAMITVPRDHGGSGTNAPSAGQLHEDVVEQLAPPSILINEDYDVIHVSANAGRYLRFPGGELSRNLLKLVHPDLSFELRAALLEARNRSDGAAAEPRKLVVDLGGVKHWINLGVRRVVANPEAARGLMLVTFDEIAAPTALGAEAARPAAGGLDIVRQMEQELQRTKDQLRITIEEYETSTEELRASNEELQAINEELRSASEELETSKEELQSVNEELSTANQEYKDQLEEIGRTNANLRNLMGATDIGIVFLDRAMRIKLFTAPAQRAVQYNSGRHRSPASALLP
jgi:two-component system, chemotaxis family, CheB/CheR fusion protein